MRRIIVLVLSVSMLAICLCGCSNNKSKLEDYITNYDEVISIIQDEFNDTNLKIQDEEHQSDEATMKQFGSGIWLLSVNDIVVSVRCEDHIAYYVAYKTSTLGSPILIYTPTGEQLQQETMNNGQQVVSIGATEVNNATGSNTYTGGQQGVNIIYDASGSSDGQ